MSTAPLWAPTESRIAGARMTEFMAYVRIHGAPSIASYEDLYEWSVTEIEAFWKMVWDFCGVIASTQGDTVLAHPKIMEKAKFFPQARLNYAENLLKRRDEGVAIIFRGEDKIQSQLSYRALYEQVTQTASAMKAAGVKEGDRVAGILPNCPETVIAMLATASLGAIWSSCSPDFGVQGILDRLQQIEPTLLFGVDAYYYGGKTFDCLKKLTDVVEQIPSVEATILAPYVTQTFDASAVPNGITWEAFLASAPSEPLTFNQVPFNHPLYILYSSGTTGRPKCIVHGHGGTLLQHLKEHQLHTDIKKGDRVFYFTTCGWMMWNWLVSALASEATLMLYDGSPFYPDGNCLFDYAQHEKITHFGTSAKYIEAVLKAHLKPIKTHDLSSLRAIMSTGSPLAPEEFEFVYTNIAKDICLSSISGGSDIVGCFALGNPIAPVWAGELQTRGLGMKVDVLDDEGHSIHQAKGELVCTRAFPSQPVSFWNDPTGEKYHCAYYDVFPDIWHHGDFVEITEHGGMIIYGRSDTILNPGGVRIGTAEIYRQVEKIDEVMESIAVGQEWDHDVRVVLFVTMRPGKSLTDEVVARIKKEIKINASPRHVPAKIIAIGDIPRTRSGKIVEVAVREAIHNRPVKNLDSLANPDSLELFRNLPELCA